LIFDLETGDFPFTDTHLEVCRGFRRIVPHLVVKKGRVHVPGSFSIELRELYESDRDVLRAIG
jgi:hypothetical protein